MQDMIVSIQALLQNFRNSGAVEWNAILTSPIFYIYLGIALFVLYWVLTIIWTIKDITSRTNNVFGQILSVLIVAVGTPLLGLPIYLFLRPTRQKWDRIAWRESLLAQVATCPACNKKNPLHHEHCTACGQKIVVNCKSCKSTYQWLYDYCPQCGEPNMG